MACHARLSMSIVPTVKEQGRRIQEAEEYRVREYQSALRIQSWFRGVRVRCYIKYLNHCAVQIQRRWRGLLGRNRVRNILNIAVYDMRMLHYNQMTTLIQKTWRGYYSRKYIFDYYSRKRYLEAVQAKNKVVLEDLKEYEENQLRDSVRQNEKNMLAAKLYWARKHHHLLSTTVLPGIYNSPFIPEPLPTEYLLQSVKPLSHSVPKLPGYNYDPDVRSYHSDKKFLPPLTKKPQGPFREPVEVQNQRYRDLNPTLRVMTDFYSLEKAREVMKNEEWVERLHDETFIPVYPKDKEYQKLLHSTSKFGHLPYGSKFFREEALGKHVSTLRFKTVQRPIPVFDKLNHEYVEGYIES